jgi:hypothetical protein
MRRKGQADKLRKCYLQFGEGGKGPFCTSEAERRGNLLFWSGTAKILDVHTDTNTPKWSKGEYVIIDDERVRVQDA